MTVLADALGPPFNGDHFVAEQVTELVQKHDVKTIIETGTYKGETTRFLCQIAKHVLTVECNRSYYNYATHLDELSNLYRHCGDSAIFLSDHLENREGQVLLFLDAHWGPTWPLVDELLAVAAHKVRPVIIIHDYKTQDTPLLGFDAYDGLSLDWQLVGEHIVTIYGADGYHAFTNDLEHSAGAKRGVLYVEPK